MRDPDSRCVDASSWLTVATAPFLGERSTHFATQSTLSRHVPLDRANGLASARSHVIGIACRANTPRTCSFDGLASQEQLDDCRSAPRLVARPKYVTTASAYAWA